MRRNVCVIKNSSSTKDCKTLRVQVPNNHILTQNLYYNYYYPNPKYLIIGYMDFLGDIIPSPGPRNLNPAGGLGFRVEGLGLRV